MNHRQKQIKLKRFEKVNNGIALECKKHGSHLKWRVHSDNNVQCRLCSTEQAFLRRQKDPLRFIYYDAKQHSKKYNREFTITLEYLRMMLELQENRCAITGIIFDYQIKPSLDRINSDLGYIPGNIQFIQFKVNRMKSDYNYSEFITLCRTIVNYVDSGVIKNAVGKRKER